MRETGIRKQTGRTHEQRRRYCIASISDLLCLRSSPGWRVEQRLHLPQKRWMQRKRQDPILSSERCGDGGGGGWRRSSNRRRRTPWLLQSFSGTLRSVKTETKRERERGLGNRPNALVFSDISQIPLQFSCSIFLCI